MNILILFLLGTQTSACVFGADKTRWKRNQNTDWTNRKKQHLGLELSARDLRKIATFSDESHFNKTLDAILVERVVGTENHRRVRKHIHNEMESLGWTVEEHAFDQRTPIGTKRFTNLIATLNPYSARRLVIACHYDSKIEPKGFLGATDSAVPCAMMVNLAYTMKDILCTHCEQDEVTLQFIFFDGEEAFEKWTTTDSLYGSRRLASDWENTPFPANGQSRTTELDRIDMFVLLDLLGMKSTSFVGLSSETEHWYDKLRTIENQLKSNKILNLNLVKKQTHYYARIEDDHIPFQQRGVPILHLISVPFPSVWHKIGDNGNALHFPTIKHLNTLLRAFSAHYLHLNV